MKTDLATAIGVAIAGTLISFFLCNLFTGEIQEYKVKSIDASISSEIKDPNPEVFNYKAINPTVEVYVGNCTTGIDTYGQCIDQTEEVTPSGQENRGNE